MGYVAVLRLLSLLYLEVNASKEHISAYYANISSTSAISGYPTTALGDYIASGLGLGGSITAAASTSSAGLIAKPSSGFLRLSSHDGANLTDQCWPSWSTYWQMSASISSMFTTFTKQVTAYDYTYSYSIWPLATTETQGDGNFPTATYVTTLTTSSQVWRTISDSNSTISMVITTRVSNTLPTPTCSLPSYVAGCQSSWIVWGNSGAHNYLGRPPCTQASIPKSLCQTVMSNWLAFERGEAGEVGGKIGLDLTLVTVNGTTSMSSSWPTSSTLAPGCTVGCQSCRVSGSRVKLLYWPPETTSWGNGTFVAATGKATGPVTAKAYGTTLTSPTVYISFDKLYASNSCKVLGSPMSNIIVAVTNSATLSSLYGWGRYWGMQETASFNFTDLYVTPVPHSIYMSQPRCASSSNSLMYACARYEQSAPAECSTENTPLLCATTLPYEPVISIPREVQQLQPEWEGCVGGIIGVYDPPTALHEAAIEDKPTIPVGGGSTVATTTQQVGSAPDATTAASPSPTVSTLPSSTSTMTSRPSDQTASAIIPSSDGPARAQATASPSDVSSDEASPTNDQESQGSADTVETQSPIDSSTKNALDVLTAAQTQPFDVLPTLANPSSVAGSPPSAVPSDHAPSRPAGSNPSIESSRSEPNFTYDPSTAEEQSTPMPSPAISFNTESLPTLPSNDPTDTNGNSPSFTFDPSTPTEQATGATQTQPILAIITAASQTLSAVQQGTHVVIIDAANTEILTSGQETIIDSSQTVKFQDPQTLIVGTSTIPLSPASSTIGPHESATVAAAVWTASDGQTFSAFSQKSGIIVAGPTTIATLPNDLVGTATILGDQTLKIVPSHNGIVVDGSSITFPASPASTELLSALPASNTNAIIFADPSTTLTVTRGQQTMVGSQTVSVPTTGGAVLVDGSSTVAVEETSLPILATAASNTSTTASSSTQGDRTLTSSFSPTVSATAISPAWSSQRRALNLEWLCSLLMLYVAYISS